VISLANIAVPLRIARRDAWRHKARSALVILMVALPVLGLTTADVLARTMQLDPSQRVTREIGQASAVFQIQGGTVTQAVDAQQGSTSSGYSGTPLTPGTPRYDTLLAKAREWPLGHLGALQHRSGRSDDRRHRRSGGRSRPG
jgi:hypothetical protein